MDRLGKMISHTGSPPGLRMNRRKEPRSVFIIFSRKRGAFLRILGTTSEAREYRPLGVNQEFNRIHCKTITKTK